MKVKFIFIIHITFIILSSFSILALLQAQLSSLQIVKLTYRRLSACVDSVKPGSLLHS